MGEIHTNLLEVYPRGLYFTINSAKTLTLVITGTTYVTELCDSKILLQLFNTSYIICFILSGIPLGSPASRAGTCKSGETSREPPRIPKTPPSDHGLAAQRHANRRIIHQRPKENWKGLKKGTEGKLRTQKGGKVLNNSMITCFFSLNRAY